MARNVTMMADLINPEVMADMISAKIPQKLVVSKIAKVDTTLQGKPGDTITVPQYAYIGDAEDIAEGVACGTVKLTATTTQVKVKKAMKAVELTDEAVLSGYGNPTGEATNQLSKAIASKEDYDALLAIITDGEGGVQLVHDGSASAIAYSGIVDAIDLFDEEVNSEKVIFVNPKQVTKLRKDSDFISADKYDGHVMMTGEIGKIANCRVVSSKRVPLDESGANYLNPIVKLNNDSESEDDAPALTIFLKRKVNVEDERVSLERKTIISADQHYAAALTNTSKVVLAKFKK